MDCEHWIKPDCHSPTGWCLRCGGVFREVVDAEGFQAWRPLKAPASPAQFVVNVHVHGDAPVQQIAEQIAEPLRAIYARGLS